MALRYALGLTLALASLGAQAQVSAAAPVVTLGSQHRTAEYLGGAGTAPSTRSVTATPGGGGITVTDGVPVAGPAGLTASLNASRAISWPTVGRAIAGAVARCLNAVSCVGSAAAAAALAHGLNRTVPDGNGGLKRDLGVPPIVGDAQSCGQITYNGNTSVYCGQSFYSACNSYVFEQDVVGKTNANPGTWGSICYGYYPWGSYANRQASSGLTSQPGTIECPPVIDFYGNNIGNGTMPQWDGKCVSGAYNTPTTEVDFGDSLQQYPPSDASNVVQAFTDWLHSGYPCESCTAPPVATLTGTPSSYTGNTVGATTWNPDGSSVLTETFPAYAFDYSIIAGIKGPSTGMQLSWTTTTTTTTTTKDPAGNVTGVTTTTSVSAPADAASAAATRTEQAKAESLCATDPTSSACAELDTPAGDDLPAVSVPFSFTPDGGWGAADGTCPAGVVLSSVGTVDVFGLVCTYATGIKFLVLGGAWLLAAFIVLGRIE